MLCLCMEQSHQRVGVFILKRNEYKTIRVGRSRNSVQKKIIEAKHGIVAMNLAMVF